MSSCLGHISRSNVVSAGSVVKITQKHRVFHWLKRYKQNLTLRSSEAEGSSSESNLSSSTIVLTVESNSVNNKTCKLKKIVKL